MENKTTLNSVEAIQPVTPIPVEENDGVEEITEEKLEGKTKRRKKKGPSKSVSLTVRLYPSQEQMLQEILKKTAFSITATIGNALQFYKENFVDVNFPESNIGGNEKWSDR